MLATIPREARVVVTDGLLQRSFMSLGEADAKYKLNLAYWGGDHALLIKGESVHLGLRVRLLEFKVGPWTVHYDPPPIPVRDCDWHFIHADYDASYEGEEDGYVSNGLGGSAASPEACLREIADMEEDKGMPLSVAA